MSWLWLFLAISLEVTATILMKYSNGFTRLVPTLAMLLFYILSLAPLAIVLKQLEVGAVYAIWSALGTVAVALLGMILFHESATAPKVVSMALIVVGVVGLNLSGRPGSSPDRQSGTEVRSELHDLNSRPAGPQLSNRGER